MSRSRSAMPRATRLTHRLAGGAKPGGPKTPRTVVTSSRTFRTSYRQRDLGHEVRPALASDAEPRWGRPPGLAVGGRSGDEGVAAGRELLAGEAAREAEAVRAGPAGPREAAAQGDDAGAFLGLAVRLGWRHAPSLPALAGLAPGLGLLDGEAHRCRLIEGVVDAGAEAAAAAG